MLQEENVSLSSRDKIFLLKAAREALQAYFKNEKWMDYPNNNPALHQKRATFVTLRNRSSHELRGCRGETVARDPLIKSVLKMTIATATQDPRFKPVKQDELDKLSFEINALTPLQHIKVEDVEVGKHGLMIVKGYSAGLLLPKVPVSYNWDRDTYLAQLCKKAGLPKGAWNDSDSTLYAFESEEWGEEDF